MQIELDLNIPLSTTGGQDMQIGLDRSHNILLSISYVMEHNKKFILDTINTLQDNNKDKLRELYETLIADMPTAKWSSNNKHQWREWWYYDHIADIIKFGKRLYDTLNDYRSLDFTFDDVVVVILLHDLEKPYKYSWDSLSEEMRTLDDHGKRDYIMNQYNIILSPIQQNGLDYIHGEWDAYSKTDRIMLPLAAFCHSIDTISARIYFNDGKI